ncbi:hypothetical protein HD553DRAFT_306011 [Filobasidium floriforme]|uniref:uncharacterized protein n=1 Tax=Filobasidium floriforme TaxID=5210 RepID=UPI001E8CC7BF|nr:uncharacterized protein HD553DRAFT_306011 [Filobasidium floriforme]KAH8088269.1 hypothetical protein HD553DRAFT_306011 [Filobasidium floriforme]
MTLSAAVVLLGHEPFLLASAVRNLCLQTKNKPKLENPGRALFTSISRLFSFVPRSDCLLHSCDVEVVVTQRSQIRKC